jgi:hypothetical protein
MFASYCFKTAFIHLFFKYLSSRFSCASLKAAPPYLYTGAFIFSNKIF